MPSKKTQAEVEEPNDDREITDVHLTPYIRQIVQGRKTIGIFLISGAAVGVVLALTATPRYTAEASLLPPAGTPSTALALASQLGSLGSSGILSGIRTSGDMYAGVLRSHTVLSAVVERFNLKDVYHVRREIDAERILAKNTNIDVSLKDSIVTLTIADSSPVRARDLANGYLDALQHANETMALTESSQRRLFFETQLEKEKEALANAEVDLKKSQEQTGLILPAGQATLQIDTIAKVKAEIAGREVELASLRDSATEQNPEVIRIKSEISDLQRQLGGLENGQTGGGNVPTAQVPELALENIRKQREVKYHEALFEILARQYESARLDESKVGPSLQVLDRPTVPEEKSGPSRVLIVVATAVFAGFFGFLWVLYTANRAALRNWLGQFTGA